MRLRSRLLLLIAGLLAGVLVASLAVIYRDVRREIVSRQDRSLEVSLAAFRNLEEDRFQRLELLARILEAEPGFRTILRRTDRATIRDHLESVVLPEYGLDLVTLTDARGHDLLTGEPADQPSIQQALSGQGTADYWLEDETLYQAVSLPLLKGRDLVDGTLSVALRLDQTTIEKLAQDTTSSVLLTDPRLKPLLSTFDKSHESALLSQLSTRKNAQKLTVLSGKTEWELLQVPVQDKAYLVLGQNTRQKLAFLEATRRKLYLLGAAALAVAMLISFPLIGRLADPVERMEQAQAELQAVVRSTQDGLIALDRQGKVTLANPAAAVALGQRLEELTVPEDLLGQTILEREGRRWIVSRTFVRAGEGDVGSLLSLRDVSADQADRERQRELFRRLSGRELTELDRRNLKALAEDPAPNLQRLDTDPPVQADKDQLQLILDNLLSNAPQATLSITRDGGAARYTVTDPGPGIPPEREKELLHGPIPRGENGLGLGLYVCQRLLERHGSRLELRRGEQFSLTFTLPACWE